MEAAIIILNVLHYEKDGRSGTRVGFVFADDDKIQNTEKFKGYSELAQFYDGSVFSKFNLDFIFKPVVGTFEIKTDTKNPLRSRTILSKIENEDGSIINLL